jgi:iron-sulfur cluster repair protein YtfE (RIC family)
VNDKGWAATRVLVGQHRSIKALLEEVANKPPRAALLRLVATVGEELMAHLSAEEAIFYPAANKELLGANAEPVRQDHFLLRLRLRAVLQASASGAPIDGPVAALRRVFSHHVSVEEGQVFPRLETAIGAERLAAIGSLLADRPGLRATRPPVLRAREG